MNAGVSAIYVEDAESEGIVVEPIIDDATREVATKAVASAYQSAKDAFATGKPLAPEAIASLEDIVTRILSQIDTAAGVALALADLATADAYTFQHSIDVTGTGLAIGQRYFRKYGWVDYTGTRISPRSTSGSRASGSDCCCTTSESWSCRSASSTSRANYPQGVGAR